MSSQRVVDDPSQAIKQNLLEALQEIRRRFDAYGGVSLDNAALEAIVERIDQIRRPLIALEHRKAVVLVDEMRVLILGSIKGKFQAIDPVILQQAAKQLTTYLESFPESGQRLEPELSRIIEELRQIRQRQTPPVVGAAQIVASDTARYSILDALKQLRKTVTNDFESAIERTESWLWLRNELRNLSGLLAVQDLTRPALAFQRLERIAEALAADAEPYRVLASGMFGEILAVLGHYLEPLDSNRPASITVLDPAEAQIAQLETLLGLPPPAASDIANDAFIPAAVSEISESGAKLDLQREPLEWEAGFMEGGAQGSTTKLHLEPLTLTRVDPAPGAREQNGATTDLDFGALEIMGDEIALDTATPRSTAVDTAATTKPTGLGFTEPVAVSLGSAAADVQDPTDLKSVIGVSEADPEFVEVFLEEAREEVKTIREQADFWRSHLNNREAPVNLRRAFHTLKGSGRMVGATVIGDFAFEYEELLSQVLSGALKPNPALCDAVAKAALALAPLVGAAPLQGGELEALPPLVERARSLVRVSEEEPITAPPSLHLEPVSVKATEVLAPTNALSSSPQPEIDPEFLEVFLEEAREELQRISQQRAVWQRNLKDHQALTTIRRAFHTLKGSGRVVGATAIGDFAWEFENLFNRLLSGEMASTAAMADLVGEAVTALERMIDQPQEDVGLNVVLADLVTRVQGLIQDAPPARAASAFDDPALFQSHVAEPVAPVEPEVTVDAVAPPVSPETVAPAEPQAAAVAPSVVPETVAPTKSQPVAEAVAPAVLPDGLADADLELIQVFQYEATEILDASDLILQRLAAEDDHSALLNDLRRNMHTLKGGSRMSGFMTIGDLAHAAESVLDALGKGDGHASPPVLETLQHTLDSLNRMLAEAAASGADPAPATNLIHDLHHLADAIGSGTPITELPTSVATAPAPAVETESTPPAAAPAPVPAKFQAMTELDQELAQIFRTEASEILDSSDVILRNLRDDPASATLLNDLRREMHTLKGSSRMAGYMTVGDLAHAAESVLDALGKGTLSGSPRIIDLIQRALDGLHEMLAGVLSGEQPAARKELIDELHSVAGKPAEQRSKALLPGVSAALAAAAAAVPAPRPAELATGSAPAAAADSIRVSAALLTSLVNQMGESSIFRARIDQGVGAMNFNLGELEQTIVRLRRQITNLATQAEARIQSRQDQGSKEHQQEFDPLELDRFTELQQVSRSLMEIADDLGNIGNTMSDHARDVTALLDQQGKVNKEIQQGLMRTGMVRFGSIIPRLRRVVRQAAQELGKRAELLVGGEDAEVDRNVLENMIAPLEHMLRNSLAHGIEMPERRRQDSKPEIGTITLTLRREGAELVVELSDDGAGLNFDAIRTKGEQKGLLTAGQPVSEEELIALLLRPGFSTATAVTQISGRGVGMDVVNEAIRAMRGALLIQTEPGQGTRFIIRLPFSLAVTQALLVETSESLFAIPLLSIELVTRLQESEFKAYLSGDAVYHQYSGRNYPIHNLGLLVGGEQIQTFEEVQDHRPPTLLFRSAEASAALQVEAVLGNREIIVKPVSPQFSGVSGISGATVLGDGRVVVVLDLAALVRNIGSQGQRQAETRALRMARQEIRPDKIRIMVIDDSITMRKVTARILERHNIEVTTAKDGLDAVAMLQTMVPDLAILDIEMPRMDGFEVVAHVRNQQNLQHMPIIMVTSRGGDKHRERAMKLGVNEYLTKPYQEDQLMESIRRILGERALELIT